MHTCIYQEKYIYEVNIRKFDCAFGTQQNSTHKNYLKSVLYIDIIINARSFKEKV